MHEDGESFNLPECKLTKADCIFDGWYDGKNVYKSGERYVIDGNDVVFYAKWVESTENNPNEEENGGNNTTINPNPITPTDQGGSGTKTPADTTTTTESQSNTDSKVTVSKPSKVKIKSIKNSAKKTMTISWKKIKAKGYEVNIALNKKFTKSKSTKLTAKTSLKVKKLKKGKTYYVRVRAYNLNGSKKVYGKWSTVKKIKIKK